MMLSLSRGHDAYVDEYLKIHAGSVQGNVDGVCGGVMVGPQQGLLIWAVAHDEVHDCMGRLDRTSDNSFKKHLLCLHQYISH